MADTTSLAPTLRDPSEPVVRSLEAYVGPPDAPPFARDQRTGQGAFLDELSQKLLASAKTMAPASEHVARVLAPYQGMARFRLWQALLRAQMERGTGVDFTNLLQRSGEEAVQALVAQGILQTREGLGASLDAALGKQSKVPAITTVGIPTAGRPEILQRALDSYLPHFKSHQRQVRVLVSDDSRDEAIAGRNRAVCAEAAQKQGAKVEYLGSVERKALIDTHAHGNAERRKALEFLLIDDENLGLTYGMPRNALLLATKGELFLCVDDDTLCRVMASPNLRPGVEWCDGATEVMPVLEVASHAEALAALRPVETDLLALHERFLGRPVAAVMREETTKPGFTCGDLTTRIARRLLRPRDRVALTVNGLVGHSGSTVELAMSLAHQPADWVRSQLNNPGPLLARLEGREVVKVADWARASSASNFMTTFYGHDNRTWTVPFLPFLRAEDQIFKEMLIRVDPSAEVAYLPYALEHAPVTSKRPTPSPITVFDMVLAALADIPRAGEGAHPKERAKELGNALAAFAEQPLPTFRRMTYEVAALFTLKDLGALRQFQKDHGAAMPAPVAELMSAAVQRHEAFLLNRDFVAADPAWVEKLGSPAAAEEKARSVLKRLGEATATLAA